jgi:nicotinamidase-related amidase
MTSIAKRDGASDNLISPDNAALIVIDYQPIQVQSVGSMPKGELVRNIVMTAKVARAFNLPIILTTVNVGGDSRRDTIPQLREVLGDVPSIDRTSMNSWEDEEFVAAVHATGRKKLLMTALWTEVCLAFPCLDALREGFDVFPIVDAVAGTTKLAHDTALRRIELAGAQPITNVQLICELQRDWARRETEPQFMNLMREIGAFVEF